MSRLRHTLSTALPNSGLTPAHSPILKYGVPVPHRRHVRRFQALYSEHYGQTLDEHQAANKLTALLVIVRYHQYERLGNSDSQLF